MMTELPTIVNVFDSTYQFRFSESYSGTLDHETSVEGYQYCTSLKTAFESLISENYTSFILMIGCITVAVYYTSNEIFRIFDSHARDLYGKSYPQGSCILLEVSSLNNLVQYFQSIHNNHSMFEVKGIHINEVQNSIISVTVIPQSDANENNKFNLSFVAAMVPCSYWNANAVATIAENGIKLYRLLLNRNVTLDHLPKIVNIYGAEISVNLLNASSTGVLLSAAHQCILVLEDIIIYRFSQG